MLRAARASVSESSCPDLQPDDPDAAKLIQDNAIYIIAAADEFDVDPKTLASIIYVENWKNVNMTEFIEKPLRRRRHGVV